MSSEIQRGGGGPCRRVRGTVCLAAAPPDRAPSPLPPAPLPCAAASTQSGCPKPVRSSPPRRLENRPCSALRGAGHAGEAGPRPAGASPVFPRGHPASAWTPNPARRGERWTPPTPTPSPSPGNHPPKPPPPPRRTAPSDAPSSAPKLCPETRTPVGAEGRERESEVMCGQSRGLVPVCWEYRRGQGGGEPGRDLWGKGAWSC